MEEDNFSEVELKKIIADKKVQRAIQKIHKAHKPTKDKPNLWKSAAHVLILRSDLKRYFKGASLRDMVNVASIILHGEPKYSDLVKESVLTFDKLYESIMSEGNNPYNKDNFWIVYGKDKNVLDGFEKENDAKKALSKWKKDYKDAKIVDNDPMMELAKK